MPGSTWKGASRAAASMRWLLQTDSRTDLDVVRCERGLWRWQPRASAPAREGAPCCKKSRPSSSSSTSQNRPI
eukprot:351511-Chlamydomonas_euryale.AAC.4